MKNNRSIGSRAEEMAARWIEKNKGYRILERNFRAADGEIDIIARDRDVYIFVEVKFRSSLRHGYPSEAVTLEKQRRITAAATVYMQNAGGLAARFDVAEILEKDGKCFIRYIENAFERRN